ncbi:D-2-hydroxyacid dehydrogenase [Puniceicoccaceae bacterium K14]|nr:D-2-hydroxyacid dehydrogenase [Puniceicoccaceae bacterium K14]
MPLKIYIDFELSPELLERLKEGASEHELIFPKKPASVLSLGALEPSFYEADVVFGQPISSEVEKAESLKWIHVSSSGITRYDTPEFRASMKKRGTFVSNSAHVYDEACADHALSFMLAQSRKLPQALVCNTPNGSVEWNRLRQGSVPLKGQKAIIVGFGAIGRQLNKLLAPFEMEITAYRRTPRGNEGIPIVSEATLPSALSQADHVINILPDSAATQNFFNAERFKQFKPGAVFYNIGRGTTVDQASLIDALDVNQVSEAWLDVTVPEPLDESHPLWKHPRCFITPHTAGGFNNETRACVEHFLENLKRFTAGDTLDNRVI